MAKQTLETINNVMTPELITQIVNRLMACSKIRVDQKDVTMTVEKLFKYITLFNSIDVYDTRVLNRDIDDIEIINELAQFIIPRSVRLSISDINSTDLLIRSQIQDLDKVALSYDDFMNLQIKFRGYVKKDVRSDVIKLSQIKVDESLSNVLPRMAVEVDHALKVRYVNDAFMPLLLDQRAGYFYRPEYFNAYASDVIKDYLAPVIY